MHVTILLLFFYENINSLYVLKIMNNKRNVFNLTQFIIRTITLFVSFVSLFFLAAVAETNNHQIDELVQINSPQADFTQWQQLVVNPRNSQQFFTIKTTGQMFIVDGMKSTEQVLDMSVNQQKAKLPIKLTAIALHPNFAFREQPGYGTFYTAHLELLDKRSKTKRIQDNTELVLKFDTVITEWQFSTLNHQTVDINTKREVLRIAVPDVSMTIQQMSFNPSRKSWNDGFGLLYIALNGSENRQEPLYSGAILRINPAKFGLRSFTVPSSNPFLKTLEIRDEIYSLGAQNIQKFFWSNKTTEKLLLLHKYSGNYLLSLVNIKGDWRKSLPKSVIYQDENSIKDTLLYRGRDLIHLRNKLLILTQTSETWLVQSLNLMPTASSITPIKNIPKEEWHFSYQQLLSKSDVVFGYDMNGEVLVLDRTTGKIFQLPHENTTTLKVPVKAGVKLAETKEESKNNMYILLIIIMTVAAGILFFIKRNKISAKAIVRTQFAQLELSESQHQIGLYHRHKSSPDTIIDIIDITTCQVKLNETPICVINKYAGHGFNDEKDQDLRGVFAKEKVDKMVDGKIRQVSLSFTDMHNKKYDICLYMRKGSDRVTKKKYSVVVNDVVDWCWLIASKINPNETKKRKEKAIVLSNHPINKTKQATEQMPLHEQAAMNRQHTPLQKEFQQVAEIRSAVETPEVVDVEASNEVVMGNEQQGTNQNTTIDTELVNALEKLVDLKQQGFLTHEEFTKAKENLLSRLFDK